MPANLSDPDPSSCKQTWTLNGALKKPIKNFDRCRIPFQKVRFVVFIVSLHPFILSTRDLSIFRWTVDLRKCCAHCGYASSTNPLILYNESFQTREFSMAKKVFGANVAGRVQALQFTSSSIIRFQTSKTWRKKQKLKSDFLVAFLTFSVNLSLVWSCSLRWTAKNSHDPSYILTSNRSSNLYRYWWQTLVPSFDFFLGKLFAF